MREAVGRAYPMGTTTYTCSAIAGKSKMLEEQQRTPTLPPRSIPADTDVPERIARPRPQSAMQSEQGKIECLLCMGLHSVRAEQCSSETRRTPRTRTRRFPQTKQVDPYNRDSCPTSPLP